MERMVIQRGWTDAPVLNPPLLICIPIPGDRFVSVPRAGQSCFPNKTDYAHRAWGLITGKGLGANQKGRDGRTRVGGGSTCCSARPGSKQRLGEGPSERLQVTKPPLPSPCSHFQLVPTQPEEREESPSQGQFPSCPICTIP